MRWQRWLAATALFVAAWFFLSWPWLSGRVTIPYDAKALFQAELQFLATAIHEGQSPFWAPNVFGGIPQIADPQSLIFSPMVLLALLAPHPSFHALDVAVLALLAIGGFSILMLFRDRGWHPAGGVVGAIAFAFGASASWRIQHIGQIESLAFFGLSLWLLARALDRASWLYGTAAGIAAGLMLVQPDQVAFLGALFLVGFVIDRWLGQGGLRAPLSPMLKPLSGAALAGILIIAVPIAMTALYATSSDRAAYTFVDATRGSLHPASLLTMLVGGLYSPMYEVPYWGPSSPAWDPKHYFLSPNMCQLYAGTLPMLAILTLGLGRGLAWAREIRFYTLALIAMLIYALGSYTPLYHLIFELPGVSDFRRPADATFLIGAGVAIVGGYIVHRVASGTVPRLGGWVRAAAIALVAFFLVASVGVAVDAGHLHDAIAPIGRSILWIAAATTVLHALTRIPARRATLAALIVSPLMAADLALNNGPSESTGVPPARFAMLEPDTQNETILLLKRLLRPTVPSDRRDRVELLAVGFEWPNAPLIHGFEQTLGYNPLRLIDVSDGMGVRDYKRVFSPLFPSYRSLLADMLGLRYIVSRTPVGETDRSLKPDDLRLLAHTADAYVYENPRALPRVLFAVNWMEADFDALIELGEWPDFDPRRTVLLEDGQGVVPPPLRSPADCPRAVARITHYENTVVEIDADSYCGGHVVLNDIWHPWWTVTVDGKPADVLKANVLFRAVEVGAGRHHIRFEFKPLEGAIAELGERIFAER